MQHRAPTNPELAGTIGFLKRKGRQTQTPLWTAVADCLGKSRRSRVVLNLGQVSRHASEGDTVVVPGKVLSSGDPAPKLTIAAFKFSPRALLKVEKAGGRCIPISRLVEENPSGTKVKLLR
ncbi:50S ribosomal protein L18e [archaeon 13_1_20CM_2_54_9]|nr:MAG: 50S ribosomal protein L18e [Crenarchaeota archaeon 13_1_40CM_3_53_5]OLE75192.1 MAG: 50S ribosomal protein L18e [archaeon 13_1_20CM_2_54_9]